MVNFLKSVANAFVTKYTDDLSEFCFVFPNKRASTFFARYVGECITERVPIIAPQMITIGDLIEKLSERDIDNRIDMLFLLYQEYCKLQPDVEIEFDRFCSWGETVLSDFNDVDMYAVDAEALFENLYDFKEIQTDFLTDEQREVVNEYFGVKLPMQSVETFWLHFRGDGEKESDISGKKGFMRLWKVLWPLYKSFNKRLEAEGLCYAGAAYRMVYDKLVKFRDDMSDIRSLLPYRQIVFVGFNVLTTVEYNIFKLLRDWKLDSGAHFADFYWDCTGPAMKDSMNTATHFTLKNKKIFKSQLDISDSDVDLFPSVMHAISAPSNTIQAKIIGGILDGMTKDKDSLNIIDRAGVAVVLPDENLLLSVLYSLPESVKNANLTMGYPLRLASVASFVALIRRLHLRSSSNGMTVRFFHDDVKALLSHPYTSIVIEPAKIKKLKDYLVGNGLYTVDGDLLNTFLGDGVSIFMMPLIDDKRETANVVCQYLITILSRVLDNLSTVDENSIMISETIDTANIETYINAIARLAAALENRGIQTNKSMVFKLIDKLLSGEKVNFIGKPLKGVQIMGVLETRCLDFEYLIIPSMNERIFPQKMRTKTFIPNNLRRGFGLATTQFQESMYAYYFYRMISRAKKVYMLYDSRTSGLRSGDLSRYLLQLKYIYKQANLKETTYDFIVKNEEKQSIVIDKQNRGVRRELEKFFDFENSKSNISASSFKDYIDCSLKFFFKYIAKIKEVREPEEFMDAITMGDIFHAVMETIYKTLPKFKNEKGEALLESKILKKWLGSDFYKVNKIIDSVIAELYVEKNKRNESMSGEIGFFKDIITKFVRNALQADSRLGEFIYKESEVGHRTRWQLGDKYVNIKYKIDRLDAVRVGDDNYLLRISDYKTGTDSLECKKMDSLFESGSESKAVFQLLFYANMYAISENYTQPIKIDLYRPVDMHLRNHSTDVIIEKQIVSNYQTYNGQFIEMMVAKMKELFDFDVPFRQTDNEKVCGYCPFKEICERN